MGTWGYKHFENDDAADFVQQLEEEGIIKIYEAILYVSGLPETEYLEAPECQQALAAMEYVAAAKGNPSPDFPEEARKWMKEKNVEDILEGETKAGYLSHVDITEVSLKAIERIETNSELQELWEETGGKEASGRELADLKKRIS